MERAQIRQSLSGPGNAYGSVGKFAPHGWQQAFDGKTDSFVESDLANSQFVGVDLRDLATARTPVMDPVPDEYPATTAVMLKCPTPGATIRCTLDGLWGGRHGGRPRSQAALN